MSPMADVPAWMLEIATSRVGQAVYDRSRDDMRTTTQIL
jgi:hypothetical protein